MLRVNNLTKYFADRVILESVTFTLSAGERVGVVGANGCGKTTLLRLIAGDEAVDGGSIYVRPGARIGYVRQGLLDGETDGPVSRLLGHAGAVWAAWRAVLSSTDELAERGEPAIEGYGTALSRFEGLGGYPALDDVHEVLDGLGLASLDPIRPVSTLSGGQRTRLALSTLLLAQPDLLLLDEPTNHLDLDGLRWLEEYLAGYAGCMLIVSHDRSFLDATVTTVLELDGTTHAITAYSGGYSAYAQAKEAALAGQWKSYVLQERKRAHVLADIRRMKEQARDVEGRTQADYEGETRFAKGAGRVRAAKVARKAVVRERRLLRSIEQDGTVEKPKAAWGLKLDFAPVSGGAREVLRVEHVSKGYAGIPVLEDVTLLVRHGERIAITGPNGGGKSTLLGLIGGTLQPDGGSVRLGSGVVVGTYTQEHERLDPRLTPLQLVRSARAINETEARTVLHGYLFAGDQVFTPIGRLSYGERARLALAELILSQANLLLLDEPTNHLDIPARERFEAALAGFSGTIVAVLHDRYAISRLATRLFELRDGRLMELSQLSDSVREGV